MQLSLVSQERCREKLPYLNISFVTLSLCSVTQKYFLLSQKIFQKKFSKKYFTCHASRVRQTRLDDNPESSRLKLRTVNTKTWYIQSRISTAGAGADTAVAGSREFRPHSDKRRSSSGLFEIYISLKCLNFDWLVSEWSNIANAGASREMRGALTKICTAKRKRKTCTFCLIFLHTSSHMGGKLLITYRLISSSIRWV